MFLALLSGWALIGIVAFLFSTVIITIFREIFPQAYFSRHALKFGSLFAPLLRLYQIMLFAVAKPTVMDIDSFLGPEAISYFGEKDIRQLIKLHMAAAESDIEKIEGQGVLNILDLDDGPLAAEGRTVNPEHCQDDVVDHDVILLWNETRRMITGGDILGRLLRGIVQNPVIKQGVA